MEPAPLEAAEHLAGWAVFGWYMLGAGLHALYRALDYARASDPGPWRPILAALGQDVILSTVVAWIWTGGYLWAVLRWLQVEVPFEVAVVPLTSLAAGFALKIAMLDRLLCRFKERPAAEPGGGPAV